MKSLVASANGGSSRASNVAVASIKTLLFPQQLPEHLQSNVRLARILDGIFQMTGMTPVAARSNELFFCGLQFLLNFDQVDLCTICRRRCKLSA